MKLTATIVTRYIPATDYLGTRIRAVANGKQVTIPYPYELSGEAVHRAAADAWTKKNGGKVIHSYFANNRYRFVIQ